MHSTEYIMFADNVNSFIYRIFNYYRDYIKSWSNNDRHMYLAAVKHHHNVRFKNLHIVNKNFVYDSQPSHKLCAKSFDL